MQIKALAAASVMALLFQMPAALAQTSGPKLAQSYRDDDDDYRCRLPEAWMCERERDGRGGWDDRDDDSGYYHPVPIYRHRISCWRGARHVERAGYYRVRMTDCVAPVYQYRAVRRERLYDIRVSARTGRILTARPVYRRY